MDWKDMFYFTNTERKGIWVLSVLIVITIFFPYLHRALLPKRAYDFSEIESAIHKYEALVADHHRAMEYIESNRRNEQRNLIETLVLINPYPFDPNELSLDEFIEMGFTRRMANNIVNFRNAGGTFRFKEDMLRLFSINEEIFRKLEDYIALPSRPSASPRQVAERDPNRERIRRDTLRTRAEREPRWSEIVIDINRADTTEWQKIRGIGPVFSRRIVTYRDLLGGFYSLDQLMEVFGMDSLRFQQIAPGLTLDYPSIRKININTADFATLVRHPYINRNQANSIVRMRERHGFYSSVNDLVRSELITESDLLKLAPYLTVDELIP